MNFYQASGLILIGASFIPSWRFNHYRFLNRPEIQASLLAGLKMPTGKKSERTDSGDLFEAEFQPGSGSWDVMAGIAVTKPLGEFSLDSNILYTLVTEGAQSTQTWETSLITISQFHTVH